MKISKLSEKLPAGFSCCREGSKIVIFKAEWEGELKKVARLHSERLKKEYPGIQYLRGRGRPLLVPFPRSRVVIRHYHHGGLLRGITRDFLGSVSRPLAELGMLEAARRAGVRLPVPLGLILAPAFGGLIKADLLTVFIGDGIDLLTYCKGWRPGSGYKLIQRKFEVAALAAKEIKKMHLAGFYHADLQLKNLLLQNRAGDRKIFVLDFDRAYRAASLTRREITKNLLRFYRSFRKIRMLNPDLRRRDALRFLAEYAPDDKDFRRYVIRSASRRRWKDFLHLKRWEFLSRLGMSVYPSPSE